MSSKLRVRTTSGSSPRTWGTLGEHLVQPGVDRFIPTYMGNAMKRSRRRRAGTVHPHVHGERIVVHYWEEDAPGSSPRTWGTHIHTETLQVPGRFIPTYMGNARGSPRRLVRFPVHPHVHGERGPSRCCYHYCAGSSPRTWGTLPSPAGGSGRSRFIPTYMGNARRGPRWRSTSPVHPHVHGERGDELWGVVLRRGSSPRTWGTLLSSIALYLPLRFIPTYMGNAYGARTA